MTIHLRDDPPAQKTTRLTAQVIDAGSQTPIAARLYIQRDDGTWHFAQSQSNVVPAVEYRKQSFAGAKPVEMHTCVPAHPFTIDLPPGKYTFTIERGKEYFSSTRTLDISDKPLDLVFPLRRWIDVSRLGWYSGDTHVHRSLEDLPAAMQSDDLNVAFPLSYWVTEAFAPPRTGKGNADPNLRPIPIEVDPTHIIYPLNTEYEIFTVGKTRHTLGAVFVLNHKQVLEEGVPPVGPVARRAREQGALLELDKHNWPWSMILVPVMNVDLYELANNHMWRTDFSFADFGEPPPDWMNVERAVAAAAAKGVTENGWIDYTFQNYYTLLNCGFRLRPTAGTASGVHPVPLGYGRVYVQTGTDFSYEAWVKGLNEGRSFVTTGPMLLVQLDGKHPGEIFQPAGRAFTTRLTGRAVSEHPLSRIEVVINGRVVETIKPANRNTPTGAFETPLDQPLNLTGSSWVIVRCYEKLPSGRVRFAHTAPWHIEISGASLRPRKAEVEFLIKRAEDELKRSETLLPATALQEYRAALERFQNLLKEAE